jgi:hypothetical protein
LLSANKFFIRWFTLLFLIFLGGCAKDGTSNNTVENHQSNIESNRRIELLKSEPADLLQKSINKGDMRFFVIGGYVPEIPIENPDGTVGHYMQDERFLKNGFYEVINVADEKQLVEAARKFAAKYNRLLLEYLKEQESKSTKAQ